MGKAQKAAGVKPVNPSIARATILKAARDAQAQVRQWSKSGDYARAAAYLAKQEALVQLLEVDDCGSTGGFDRLRKQLEGMRGLDARLDWLEGLEPKHPVVAALQPATDWLDANQQEALSGALRQIIRTETL